MKIVIATESFYPNIDGGAVAQYNLAQELSKKGHDVTVIAPGYSFKNTFEQKKGIDIYRTRAIKLPFYMNGRYYFSPFPFLRIGSIIKKKKPDVVNICSPYPVGISSFVWAVKKGIPVVGSIHVLPQNLIAPFKKVKDSTLVESFFWKYLVYFFNHFDWATIPTETGAEIYKKHGLKTPITHISNGIKTDVFNPENNGEYLRKKFDLPEKNIILCSGRMTAEKNLDVLIEAIPDVIDKVDAHFLFVGSGGEYKNYLMNMVKDLNVDDYTTFTDFLDWKDYPNIFTIADLFAMPSEAELQSIVTMEAVASGLPVVAVNKGAVPELVDMNNGLIFEPKKSNQMANKIIKILTDQKLKEKMSENSLKLIKKHSLKSVASQFEQVYKKAVSNYNQKKK